MKVGAFEVNEPVPELNEPHALVMLQPWVDVGSVGTLMLAWLEKHFGAEDLARLAVPGDFFDFTRYRPTVYLKEGVRQIAVPNTFVTCSKQNRGHDFIFIHMLEPHGHAETYVDSLLRLLVLFKVKRYCLLGSMYDFVPHTRPLLVTGRATGEAAQQELKKMGVESSDYQGPTTITFLVQQRGLEMGMETMSLLVRLPQYTQLDEDYMGASRLMQALGSIYGFSADKAYLQMAEEQLKEISGAIEKNPQLKAVVEQLEARYDGQTRKKQEEQTPKLSPDVESFLSEMEKRFREGRQG